MAYYDCAQCSYSLLSPLAIKMTSHLRLESEMKPPRKRKVISQFLQNNDNWRQQLGTGFIIRWLDIKMRSWQATRKLKKPVLCLWFWIPDPEKSYLFQNLHFKKTLAGFFFYLNAELRLLGKESGMIWPSLGLILFIIRALSVFAENTNGITESRICQIFDK